MLVTRIILAGTFLFAACGPVESTSLRWRLEETLRQAQKSGAQRLAPYEITAARRYHHKGKEEAGYSQYESAIDYFHKANRFAKQAVERAEANAKLGPRASEAPEEAPVPTPAKAPAKASTGKAPKPKTDKGKTAAGSPGAKRSP